MRGAGVFGVFQLIWLALAGGAQALSYRLTDAELAGCGEACPKVIVATGTVGQQEYLAFSQFVDDALKNGKVGKIVVIDSPGGFNVGAAGLGMVLRQLKMTVIVGRWDGGTLTASSGLGSGTCASACVLVLAGGASRYFVPGSRVGVHRSHLGPEVRDPTTRQVVSGTVNADEVREAYSRYFRTMGVNSSLSAIMDKTPPETMHWLSDAEMAKFRLARNAKTRR